MKYMVTALVLVTLWMGFRSHGTNYGIFKQTGGPEDSTHLKRQRLDSLYKAITILQKAIVESESKLYKEIQKAEEQEKEHKIKGEVKITPKSEKIKLSGLKDIDLLRQRLKYGKKLFYGKNDVTAVPSFSVLPAGVRNSAKCVCAIIDTNFMKKNGDGYVLLSGCLQDKKPLGLELCTNEKFLTEITPCNGTGWAFKSNAIITAEHSALTIDKAQQYYYVFGLIENTSNVFIPASRVYKAKAMIEKKVEDKDYDFSIIQLDKTIDPDLIGILKESTQLTTEDTLYMLGHPNGLPIKYTPNGLIFSVTSSSITTNLDAYKGNSGSPVFNSKTHAIEGILIEGDTDFEPSEEGCAQSVSYITKAPEKDTNGEIILRLITILKKYK